MDYTQHVVIVLLPERWFSSIVAQYMVNPNAIMLCCFCKRHFLLLSVRRSSVDNNAISLSHLWALLPQKERGMVVNASRTVENWNVRSVVGRNNGNNVVGVKGFFNPCGRTGIVFMT
jgi:hypothetical protein